MIGIHRRSGARNRKFSAFAVVLGLFIASSGVALASEGAANAATTSDKVWVCKYVSTAPSWTLKSGNGGLVDVGVSSLAHTGFDPSQPLPQFWGDSQGGTPGAGSVAFVYDTGQSADQVTALAEDICPGFPESDSPAAPVFTDGVCSNGAFTGDTITINGTAVKVGDSLVVPDPTNPNYPTTYKVTGTDPGTVTVTATEPEGFSVNLTTETVGTWTHLFPKAPDCSEPPPADVDTPDSPVFVDSTCTGETPSMGEVKIGGVVVAPGSTKVVGEFTYTVTGAIPGQVTVKVTEVRDADDPNVEADNVVLDTWTHTFETAVCPDPDNPAAPTFTDSVCSNGSPTTTAVLVDGVAVAPGSSTTVGEFTYNVTGSLTGDVAVTITELADADDPTVDGGPVTLETVNHTFTIPNCAVPPIVTAGPPPVIPTVVHAGMASLHPANNNGNLVALGEGLAAVGVVMVGAGAAVGLRRKSTIG